MKLYFRTIFVLIAFIGFFSMAFAQKPSKSVRKQQKKIEKAEIQEKRTNEKTKKESIKRKYKIQTKETQDRIKQSRKEAQKHNKKKNDPFFVRPFKKKKAKKRR